MSKYCILYTRLDKNVCLLFFDDHTIGKVTFDYFQVSTCRRIVPGVETCLTRLKDCCCMIPTTFTPRFTGMDVTYEATTDESSDFEALIGNDS